MPSKENPVDRIIFDPCINPNLAWDSFYLQ